LVRVEAAAKKGATTIAREKVHGFRAATAGDPMTTIRARRGGAAGLRLRRRSALREHVDSCDDCNEENTANRYKRLLNARVKAVATNEKVA
jgi:hypothetical protein